jgi:hypothetical protein
MAPAVEKGLPTSVSFVFISMAALLAMMVPLITTAGARLTKPSIYQKTLQANAPLINLILAAAFAENAACI